ncbi:MAG TPA: hypothetical protein VG900_13640 [Hyphomicrobiaceae bacterium]|nr:hypothetical protein [Hyphomicrobiaceae bacterium]
MSLVLLAVLAPPLALGGCGKTLDMVKLPDFAKPPETLLTKDQQKQTVNDMIEKGQTHQQEAAQQIEKGK